MQLAIKDMTARLEYLDLLLQDLAKSEMGGGHGPWTPPPLPRLHHLWFDTYDGREEVVGQSMIECIKHIGNPPTKIRT